MPQVGFIRSKNEIKYLILYIAERLIAPVSFETMQELTMCDPAIDYFEFSECLSYLVQTGHMTRSKDEQYAYFHAIWHVFILLGSLSHTAAMLIVLA